MKTKKLFICCSVTSIFLLFCVWCTHRVFIEKANPKEEVQNQASSAVINTDSAPSIDWNLAEDILMQYVNSVEKHVADSCFTQEFYDTIVNYYMLNNPSDGALAEILSSTTYLLFESHDSLCSTLDKFMRTKQIPANLCDTIWYRIAFEIQCYFITEEDDNNIRDVKKADNIMFLENHGYWLDDIEDYLPYVSND